jgi:hypothetical protein
LCLLWSFDGRDALEGGRQQPTDFGVGLALGLKLIFDVA